MATHHLKPLSGQGRPIPLGEDPVTIGRHADNKLRLNDDKCSRHHAVISPEKGEDGRSRFRIKDLGSRNGTLLNGMRVTESIISPGDEIRIGAIAFTVEAKTNQLTGNVVNGARNPSKGSQAWATDLKNVLESVASGGLDDETVKLVDALGATSEALAAAADGPRAFRYLLRIASRTRATDIHVEPKADLVQVRMRVDGQMVWIADLPKDLGILITGITKAICQMQQASKEAVQDGHFSARFPDRRVEYRVSLTPSMYGQKLVVRVLDQRGVPTAIEDLGMATYMADRIKAVCNQDAGLLLVCGPTGSGKTTTLYNALRDIDREARNVITIEDPVEYQLEGVTQMPIDEKRGNTFNTLLRSVLRQDPDVILLGEIRDEQTARTAMQAAMTGHLVFSTVHAKDSISSVFRLLDLKIEPFLVANALQLVLAQRLVRALCENCKSEVQIPPGRISKMGRFLGGKTSMYQSVGCRRCLKTGYRGRLALFELLDVDDDLRDIILNEPSIQAMRKVIAKGHFTSLPQSGYKLVGEGLTSAEEIDRVAT
ncbi:MAG: general secretion pathway protein E [Phycisphaerales bacterium]|jgi:general secretion pathway protein E